MGRFDTWRLIWRLDALEGRMFDLENKQERMGRRMAKDKEALARLDEQIAALRDYVRSDEETDAAEVDRRTEELRTLIAEVQGSGEAPAEAVAEREEELAAVTDEAAAQTGAATPAEGQQPGAAQ